MPLSSPQKYGSLLLVQQYSQPRKQLRNLLDQDGHAVLAVETLGEAMARLKARHFDLVVCTDRHPEDNQPLIDQNGLLMRNRAGYDLYLPGIGIDAKAVLIVATTDSQRVRAAVRDAWTRLAPSPDAGVSKEVETA